MNIIMLRKRIYDLKYAGACYKQLASLANIPEIQKQMLNFEADCLNNMQKLVRMHQDLMISPYDPIINEPFPFTNFKEGATWMLKYESQLYRMFVEDCYQQYSFDYTILATYINEVENHHCIYLTHCIFL